MRSSLPGDIVRLKRLKRPKGLVGTDSDCQGVQKSAQSAQKAQKGSGGAEIDCQCAGKYCALSALCALRGAGSESYRRRKMRVVCVIRVLSGWNVRRKLLERLNGYADFVALAAKSFVS